MTNETNKRIFLDYAAATPVSEKALQAYIDASRFFANPQALHTEGLEAARVRDDARGAIAKVLGVKSQELIFTSGGTESNNLALTGYLMGLEEQGIKLGDCHIIVSGIEHPSVGDVFAPLVARGLEVSLVAPNEHGVIRPEAIQELLQENTVLVSVALVNSEIGTVQPIHAIGKLLKETKPTVGDTQLEKVMFHTDACQGLYQSLVPPGLGVDLMSLDSGKMYGPRGAGVLYIRRGVKVAPVLRGGSQEQGLRPGTENVALYVGFAAAFVEAAEMRASESERVGALRDQLFTALQNELTDMILNGDSKNQAPHILNVSVPDIDAEYVMMYLDQRGISFSSKSACLERSDASRSHVVAALGGPAWRATNTLRISFGRDSLAEDITTIAEKIIEAIEKYKTFG